MGDCCCKKGEYTATATEDDDFQHVGGSRALSVIDGIYLKAEYMAMASSNHGMLTHDQFIKLLMFLGYGGDGQAEALVKAVNKDENTVITLDEYYDAMNNNPEVMQGTRKMRELFRQFDDNKDGKASLKQIEQGFQDIYGMEVDDEMKKDIAKMDENGDGSVFYKDFVIAQLKKKGFISS